MLKEVILQSGKRLNNWLQYFTISVILKPHVLGEKGIGMRGLRLWEADGLLR